MVPSFFRAAMFAATFASATSWGITFQTLYTFPEDASNGKFPETALTIGPDGNLYGTTTEGGTHNAGTVFRITPAGAFASIASFEATTTGKLPRARLLNPGDGSLYGATEQKTGAAGTVYRLDPAGLGSITTIYTVPSLNAARIPVSVASGQPGILHVLCSNPAGVLQVPISVGIPNNASVFNSMNDVGYFPTRFIRGTDGLLYGTTNGTGNSGGSPYEGTIFRVNADGTNVTTLYNFDYETTGGRPEAALAVASNGILYGVTRIGGSARDGVIFRFNPAQFNPGEPGSGYTILKHLNGTPISQGDLLLASDNKLYGTTTSYNRGFIWRINLDGSGFQTLMEFKGTNGYVPQGGLVQGTDGFLYGTTRTGTGSKVNGTIFKIDLNLPDPPINHRPVANTDFTTATNNVAKDIDVLANDYDADQDARTLAIAIIQQPTHGTATVQDGKIRYTPVSFNGYDELRYKVTDSGGLESTAYAFIQSNPEPSSWTTNTYIGLINLDPNLEGLETNPKGLLTIKVSAKRAFTGTLMTNGSRVPVRGIIASNDLGIARVNLPKAGKAWLLMGPAQGNVMSAFLFGKETWFGAIAPVIPGVPKVSEPFTARFSTSDVALPDGHGFAVTKILPTGLMTVVGKAGDGSTIRFSSGRVSHNGTATIPFYSRPTKDGYLSGYVDQETFGGVQGFGGNLLWVRQLNSARNAIYPFGFNGGANAFFYPYTPPVRGEIPIDLGSDNSGYAVIEGPQFAGTPSGTFVKTGARFGYTGELKSLSINRSNGLFSGKMKTPDGKSASIRGVVLQEEATGYGQFLLNKETGSAVIGDTP